MSKRRLEESPENETCAGFSHDSSPAASVSTGGDRYTRNRDDRITADDDGGSDNDSSLTLTRRQRGLDMIQDFLERQLVRLALERMHALTLFSIPWPTSGERESQVRDAWNWAGIQLNHPTEVPLTARAVKIVSTTPSVVSATNEVAASTRAGEHPGASKIASKQSRR